MKKVKRVEQMEAPPTRGASCHSAVTEERLEAVMLEGQNFTGTCCEGTAACERCGGARTRPQRLGGRAWSDSACTARIMQMLSAPPTCSSGSGKPPLRSSPAWPALSGLRVVGSFRKLRSSVLQGIQSRAGASGILQGQADTGAPNPSQGDSVRANQEVGVMVSHHRKGVGQIISNGQTLVGQPGGLTEGERGEEQEEEEEVEEEVILHRNTHYSRSLRRAYGAGRISLLDTGQGQERGVQPEEIAACLPNPEPRNTAAAGQPNQEPRNTAAAGQPNQEPRNTAAAGQPNREPRNTAAAGQPNREPRNTAAAGQPNQEPRKLPVTLQKAKSGKVLDRLSRSTDSLHLFKSPFRSKAPSPCLDRDAEPMSRAGSASSVAPGDRSSARWRGLGPKLVSSMTDLATRPRAQSCTRTPPSALSQLHDAYSRRASGFPETERQRRPSPARGSAGTPGGQDTAASMHPYPLQASLCDPCPLWPQVPSAQVSLHAHCQDPSSVLFSPSTCTPERPLLTAGASCHSPGNAGIEREQEHSQAAALGCHRDQAEDRRPADEVESENGGEACRLLDVPDWPSNTTNTAENSSSVARVETDVLAASTPTQTAHASVHGSDWSACAARRRTGRAAPRPVSDYGQLGAKSFCIPEEAVGQQCEEVNCVGSPCPENYNSDASGDCSPPRENYNNGAGRDCSRTQDHTSFGEYHFRQRETDRWKRRPISVIGGIDLYSSPSAEERGDLLPTPNPRPPVPLHQVPPYRSVSARLRPSPLSQSTPTGLNRLGSQHHQLHRVLSNEPEQSSGLLDDSVSEEDCSFDELSNIKPSLQSGQELSTVNELISSGHAVCAEALWDHVTMEDQELAFKAGEVIRVLDASHKDWWWGAVGDREAWFPSSFVRVRVNQEQTGGAEDEPGLEDSPTTGHTVPNSELRDQMRTNVVKEIMSTERVYFKHLKDICEGYIRQCRKHPGMFTPAQLKTIFSNIEDIYRFHWTFLRDLEQRYNKHEPHLSEVGSCFLQQGDGFSVYSEYCNNHPGASAELHRLMKLGRYRHFFEACRLLQQMIDISLAGFLLTPVQKICKYPLQLGELLKYTPPEHRDYESVSNALEAMKNVARLINERKRRLESIDAIAQWQVAVLHWEGEDVLSRSSELIHSGDLVRTVRHGRPQQRRFFLFDHQLVFCKKDLLRRDLLHYRGRLDMDRARLMEAPDGARHAFQLWDEAGGDSWLLSCKRAEDKARWLEGFSRERRRVQEDQEMGMEITENQRKQAILNARKSKRGNMKSMGRYVGCPVPLPHQPLHPLHQRHVTVPTSLPHQRVFSLAEPKRKSPHLWHSLTHHTRFRKRAPSHTLQEASPTTPASVGV